MRISSKHSNQQPIKSTEALLQIMEEVLTYACRQGASDAAVSIEHDRGFSVDVRMKEVETVRFNEDKTIDVTVYIGKKRGEASSSDTSPQALEDMVKAAYDIAAVSAIDPYSGLPDKALMTLEKPHDLDLFHPWDVTPPEAIDLALACENEALALDTRIVNSDGVHISSYISSYGYANTEGASGVVHSSRHGASCSLIAKLDEKMQRDYAFTAARHAKDLLALNRLAHQAVEKTTSRLGARQIKTQKAPVVFSPRVAGSLFSSFIQAISGGNLYRKNSFLVDALGKTLFPSFVRIYEQPHLLGALGSAPFDSEGVPTRANVIVDKGTLEQYVLSSYSARRLGLKTTANGGGVFNLTIEPTSEGLADILKQMGRGLLVTELMGQGVNLLTGDYSRGASGFWVEEGVIQYPVEEITIAGQLQQMFRRIAAIGNDRDPNFATRCGSVLIEEMTIAGN